MPPPLRYRSRPVRGEENPIFSRAERLTVTSDLAVRACPPACRSKSHQEEKGKTTFTSEFRNEKWVSFLNGRDYFNGKFRGSSIYNNFIWVSLETFTFLWGLSLGFRTAGLSPDSSPKLIREFLRCAWVLPALLEASLFAFFKRKPAPGAEPFLDAE